MKQITFYLIVILVASMYALGFWAVSQPEAVNPDGFFYFLGWSLLVLFLAGIFAALSQAISHLSSSRQVTEREIQGQEHKMAA